MNIRTDTRWDRRGSALIVVLLVLLALTALGMVAMRTVGQSLDRSGTYRLRASADDFSDAAARFFVNDAPRYASSLTQVSQHAMRGQSYSNRNKLAARGGYIRLTQKRSGERDFSKLPSGNSESGLLTDGQSSRRSLESMNPDSNFEIIIRNPSHSISMPGYSEDFCFQKVTIASQAQLGDTTGGWDHVSRVGKGRTTAEGFVPLSDCN